VHTLDYYC